MKTSNGSELCPDLLRCVFKRLSFTSFITAKSVCSSWHSASKGCVPKQNHIPWLILFPRSDEDKDSCVLYVPDDRDRVYRTRDLGVEFVESRCLNTCGSWLLMCSPLSNLYILNALTGERIDLPDTTQNLGENSKAYRACFWIDDQTKDYLVIWIIATLSSVYTKKGDHEWRVLPLLGWYRNFVYSHKDRMLYLHRSDSPVEIWDFSGDGIPQIYGYLDWFRFNHHDFYSCLSEEDRRLYWERLLDHDVRIALTVSGDVLMVECIVLRYKTCYFRIYKTDHVTRKWVKIDSLGDEALICDTDCTVVVAKDIPGIKSNSIYFSGVQPFKSVNHKGIGKDPDYIFVFDLATQKMEPLPQCVVSNILNSTHARWFFPS